MCLISASAPSITSSSHIKFWANVGARLSSFYFSNMLGFALGLGKDSRENVTPLDSFSHVCCLLPPIRLSAPVSRRSVLSSASPLLPPTCPPLSLPRIASCVIHLTPCFLNTSYLWGSALSTGSLVAFWQDVVHWRREWQTTSVFLPWEPHSTKRQKDRILKEELPRLVGAQYATGDQWKNNSRNNEGMEPKQNNTQVWMWLVIEARSDAIKSNIA